jgi:tetratricopeptide (TPR) repeat protein
MNTCGYDADLGDSNPVRSQIRAEVARNVQSVRAQDAVRRMCSFYDDKQAGDNSRQLAQYVSLALHLGDAPSFSSADKEADLPPDAENVLGLVPLLQNFWVTADLERIWRQHSKDYDQLLDKYHKPVTDLLFATDIYLKQPQSGYVGRTFTVYLEPMAAPSQVNARNYGTDYFMVVSPEKDQLKLNQIRHTYLHYILDPLMLKRASTMKRLNPLLDTVQAAPMDDKFKQEIDLLVTESLIRAIEARLLGGEKGPEAPKQAAVDSSMREGFVLTQYFYEALLKFEPSPVGLKDAYGDWLYYIDMPKELKLAKGIRFASSSTPEVVAQPRKQLQLLDLAENQLASGNSDNAEKLARQAIANNKEDVGRASFVLARAATLKGDMQGAEFYFDKAIKEAQDPKTLAWSHIYMGRIADLKEERETALEHYKAAAAFADAGPEAKAAAEKGLETPYEPSKTAPKH